MEEMGINAGWHIMRTRLRKIVKNTPYKKQCIVAIPALLFIFLTMYYRDIVTTIQHTMIFIDSLFDGKYASFYNNALAVGMSGYDIGIYIVFAIWGLPVWLLKTFGKGNPLSLGSLLWFKLMLILFMGGCLWLISKIAVKLEIREEIRKYILILESVSFVFIFPVLVVAQYDVVPLFFMLLGIWQWLEGKKKGCLSAFAVSFTMKPFTMLIFILLVLLEEKKVSRILKAGVLGVIPLGICKGIYLLNPVNTATNNSFFLEMFYRLLAVSIPVGNGDLPLFVFIAVFIYIAAYAYMPIGNKTTDGKWLIWFSFLLWADFCFFAQTYPYWIIYMAPFLLLVLCFQNLKINLMVILDFIVNIMLIMIMSISYPWVYGGNETFSYLLLKPFYERMSRGIIISVGEFLLSRNFIDTMHLMYPGILLAALVGIAWQSYKGIKESDGGINEKIVIDSWHLWLRIFLLYGWGILCLMLMCCNIVA